MFIYIFIIFFYLSLTYGYTVEEINIDGNVRNLPSHRIDFTTNEIDVISALANNLTISPSEYPDLYCIQAKELSEYLPKRIKDLVKNFVKYGSNTGMLLLSSIPIDDQILPQTPQGNHFHIGETTLLSRIQAIINHSFGNMIGFEAEGFGGLFQDMVPKFELAQTQTSLGSNVELEIHTEQAFSKLRPDAISLACLRGDLNAKTYVFPVHIVLQHLSFEEIEMLRQPLWITGVDMSFKLDGHEFIEGDIRGPLPILFDSEDDPKFVFDQDLMHGINDEAEALVKKIINLYYQYRFEHNLKPGEMILVDNRRAVHGRSPFQPRFDGYDRFIVRSFVVLDLEKSKYARLENERVIAARFS